MATTLTLNAKYPDWTRDDWDRFRWINSWDRRRRNLAPLFPCKRCGTAPIFEENQEDIAHYNMFRLSCPKCHQYLGSITDLKPVHVWLHGFKNQKCTFPIQQNGVPLQMVRLWNHYNFPLSQRHGPTLWRPGQVKIGPRARAATKEEAQRSWAIVKRLYASQLEYLRKHTTKTRSEIGDARPDRTGDSTG
jgi:hypothetical protein